MHLDPGLPAHGGQLRYLSERFGIPASRLIDFSVNINPAGPPGSTLAALRDAMNSPAIISSYPDLDAIEIKSCIAAHTGIDRGSIAVANGFVPLLEAALRSRAVRRCLLPVPAFGEYRRTLERLNIAVTPYPLTQASGFRYDPDRLIAELTTGRYDAVLLANPQNPSGALCERSVLLAILKAAAQASVHVLLDEAFIDYAPEHSLLEHFHYTRRGTGNCARGFSVGKSHWSEMSGLYTNSENALNQAHRFKTLTVFRSVTKFYALAGLRVAYAISHPKQNAALAHHLAPWPVTTLASLGVCAALNDATYASDTLADNRERRDRLAAQLQELGIHTYPSAANFLLLRLPIGLDAQECWQRLLIDHAIVLRNCGTFEALAPGHLRCAIRTYAENAGLVTALRQYVLSASTYSAPGNPNSLSH